MATILVVDDSRDVAQLFALLLRESGYAVDIAFGGREALKMLTHQRFDLILLDQNMPDLTGLEVLEAINQMQLAALPAVVMISAYRDTVLVEAARKHGAKDYLLKGSISADDLVDKIKAYC